MAQRLRVLATLTEDQGLVPSIHTGQLTVESITPAPRDLMPFLASTDTCMHMVDIHTARPTQTHKQISKDTGSWSSLLRSEHI